MSYGQISSKWWSGKTGKAIVRESSEFAVIAFYLMTCTHRNKIGLYYLPKFYIENETRLSNQTIADALHFFAEASIGFARYDNEAEMVFVRKMALHNICGGRPLKRSDNRIKGVINALINLPETHLIYDFYLEYRDLFYLDNESSYSLICPLIKPYSNTPLQGALEGACKGSPPPLQPRAENQPSEGASKGALEAPLTLLPVNKKGNDIKQSSGGVVQKMRSWLASKYGARVPIQKLFTPKITEALTVWKGEAWVADEGWKEIFELAYERANHRDAEHAPGLLVHMVPDVIKSIAAAKTDLPEGGLADKSKLKEVSDGTFRL